MEPAKRVPMTGTQIQACTVGAARTLTLRLQLVEYDPISPVLFELEAARTQRALGGLVMRIEHTGSTSVPGLAAKPIVDMLLVVPDSSDEDAYLPALVAAGSVLRIREPDGYEHRVFKGPDTDASLHVLSDGCEEIEDPGVPRLAAGAPRRSGAVRADEAGVDWAGLAGGSCSSTPTRRPR